MTSITELALIPRSRRSAAAEVAIASRDLSLCVVFRFMSEPRPERLRLPPGGSADSGALVTRRSASFLWQMLVEHFRDEVLGVRRVADDALGLLAVAEKDQGRDSLNAIAGRAT